MKFRYLVKFIVLLFGIVVIVKNSSAQLPSSKPINATYPNGRVVKPEQKRTNNQSSSSLEEKKRLPSAQPISATAMRSKSRHQQAVPSNTSILSETEKKAKLPSNKDWSDQKKKRQSKIRQPLPPVSF